MKRIKLLIVCLVFSILFCSSQVMAIDLYGFGSYWDKKDADGSWGGGVGLSLPFITERLRIDGRAYFFENSDLGNDGDITLLPLDLGLQVHLFPSSAFDPYALGGVSYIYADADRIDVDSNFGVYLGLGLDMNIGIPLIKLFGEVIYRTSELDRKFGEDIDVSGFTGNIGLKIHI